MFTIFDEQCMRRALELAYKAEESGEVPVGAVLVLDNQIIGEGYNQPIFLHDVSAHAEIMALRSASQSVKNYRLPGSTLYTTLEPCIMCAGAIIQARVQRVVFAAWDERAGAAGSVFNLLRSEKLNHICELDSGLFMQESREKLQAFFKARRVFHSFKK